MSNSEIKTPAPAAYHAIEIIELLASEPTTLGISEIGRKLDLNINMVYRVLNTLQTCNWVYFDEDTGKYQLTLRPFEITSKSREKLSLYSMALPFMHKLWKNIGEGVSLSIFKNERCFYLIHIDGTRPVRITASPGSSYSLYSSAPGKILLAYSSPEYIERYTSRNLKAYTDNTLVTKAALKAELELIRTQGYATDNEEYGRGIICCAYPVFDGDNHVVAAVHTSVLLNDYSMESMMQTLAPQVKEAAESISAVLGHKQ